jgi:hypothetical protein
MLDNDGKAPAEFLILLDIGCKRPSASVSGSGAARTVTVAGQRFTFE